jgi:hypothetical protein
MEDAMAALAFLVIPLLAALPVPAAGIRNPQPGEPDGSRPLGIIPPFHGQPAPPAWLRQASHALAIASTPNTRHYLYEAYADGGSRWLVRYVRLPDGTEDCAETQVAFLFGADPLDPLDPPRRVQAFSLQVRSRRAEWEGRSFVLVDKRDLITRPGRPRP